MNAFTKEKVSEGQGRDYPGALSIRNTWEVVEKWFSTFNVTIGPKAEDAMQSTDRTTAEMTARLFYT